MATSRHSSLANGTSNGDNPARSSMPPAITEEDDREVSNNPTTTTTPSSSFAAASAWDKLEGFITRILLKTSLRPHISLRRQLFWSFGITSFLALIFFVAIGILTASLSGQSVMDEARNVQKELARHTIGTSARYVAETVTKLFNNFETASDIVRQVTQDRIVGYKLPEFLDPATTDNYIPFIDQETQKPQYPLHTPDLMRLDWNISTNINSEQDAREHLSGRDGWYVDNLQVNTAYSSYFMQGACNPSALDPSDPGYYPNCSDANNDLSTGGVVQPSPTNFAIAQKASDLTFVLKALFERHLNIKQIGIYFANSGAGSHVRFPAQIRNGAGTFSSIGCEWMATSRNPLTGRPLGTFEEIERCHSVTLPRPPPSYNTSQTAWPPPKQAQSRNVFSGREYNGLERPWCARQAEAPHGQAVVTGPYLDAGAQKDVWVLTFGHGVFDRVTQEFIGCTLVDVSVEKLLGNLEGARVGNSSQVALIRWDKPPNDENSVAFKYPDSTNRAGTVVVATKWDPLNATEPIHITNPQLEMGVDQDVFLKMQALVDYDSEWDPEQVREAYRTTFLKNDRLIMMYPVPYVPSTYDPSYYPNFMVVMSISEAEVFDGSDIMDETVWSDIRRAVRDMCLVGACGLLAIFAGLLWVSRTLTKPLAWMQTTTAQVINNAGNEDLAAGTRTRSGGKDNAGQPGCAPQTEVTVLLSEFEMMMDGFSGTGAAEVAVAETQEVKNKFQWREDYQVLYPYNFGVGGDSRDTDDESCDAGEVASGVLSVTTEATLMSALSESSIVQAIKQPCSDMTSKLSKSVVSLAHAGYSTSLEKLPTWAKEMFVKATEDKDDVPDYVVSPPQGNTGHNIRSSKIDGIDAKRLADVSTSSRLFSWITCLIVIPLVLSAACIVFLGEFWIRSNLDIWLADVKEASYILEKDALITATLARSTFGGEVMDRFTRDIHLLSRVAGWLLFGALQRSKGFSQLRTGTEQCKSYDPDTEVCPFKNDVPCDCAWNDPHSHGECSMFGKAESDSRFLQTMIFEGQMADTDEFGDRLSLWSTSFPNVSTSPEETSWWDNPSQLPGVENGANASGFDTTYDRVRVLSALSTIIFPLYNYFPGRDEDRHLGSYIGLENDGMMVGYVGCSSSHADWGHFQSTNSNRAGIIRPDLCPLNKYGYDPRCRDWYAQGKVEPIHFTPPYEFASTNQIGTSASFALRNGAEFVGEALLDFLPTSFTRALGPDSTVIGPGDQGFPLLITPDADIFGGNTVIGPNYTFRDGPIAIQELVSPSGPEFDDLVERMSNGEEGSTQFTRKNEVTKKDEEVIISYAPVKVAVLTPLDPSDFSRGCNVSSKLVYSLGIAIVEGDLYLRYEGVESSVYQNLKIARGISIAAMVVVAVLFTMLTYFISLNIARPIIALTRIVKSIKNKSLRDEIPDVEGGSQEVAFVHESFQRLMKVVRFANTAFFAGDRTQSFVSMEDALNLFNKLGNQKAIGVANNNLGTMVLQEQLENHGTERLFDNSLFGVCISEIYFVGMGYFDEAIRNGKFEYELAKDTDDKGPYAKQLANRYFNRGMFLVVVRNHPLCPSWIHEDGVNDILTAKSLDEEVLQFLHERNLFHKNEVQEFETILRRTRGILSLSRNYGFHDAWGVDSLIERAEIMLNDAREGRSKLFKKISRVGRTQQIDDLKVQRELCEKNYEAAAKIAMRMLVEDEYIIDTVIVNAVTAVSEYFRAEGIRIPATNATQYLQRETRKAQVNSLRESKNIFFCLDKSGSMTGERMERANKNLRWVYDEHCSDKDWVGFVRFNHDVDEKLFFPMGKKGDHKEVQEAILAQALDADGGTRLYSALNRVVTQILETDTKNDTWIIALTDGESSWDHPAKRVTERIMKANKIRSTKIHVIIIGFDVPSSVIKTCEGLTKVTKNSLYIDARGGDLLEMDKAFEQVVSVIGGSAITMETF